MAVAAGGVALVVAFALIATHGHGRPAALSATPVQLSFTPGSGYSDTGVVKSGKSTWLATASGTTNAVNQVRIFRWDATRWAPSGVVEVPALPSISEGGFISAVSLTRSGAPDFTLNTYGADTHWFSVIARRHGKWQLVRFDYGYGPTTAIDAWGTKDHLVRAEANGCGCASGPETYAWYRFDGWIFVPTDPPSGPAACTNSSLESAAFLPYAPQLSPTFSRGERQQFRAHLSVARSACADGWALATIRGRSTVALFEQRDGHWLRDLVGAPKEIRNPPVGFAIPDSLLWTLASRIGVSLGRRPTEPHYSVNNSSYRPPAWERGAVSVPVIPGSSYTDTRVVYRRHQKWFAIALEPSRATKRHHHLDVYIYRWRKGSWIRDGEVSTDFTTPHPEGPVFWPQEEWVGGAAPGFSFSPTVSTGAWKLVISKAGGAWHVVPFRTAHGNATTVDVDYGTRTHFYSYVSAHRYVLYRYRSGTLVPGDAQTDPPCDRHILAPRRWKSPKFACSYGWALVTGTRGDRRKLDVFRAVGGRWRSWLVESARRVRQLTTDMGIPFWELAQLAPKVE